MPSRCLRVKQRKDWRKIIGTTALLLGTIFFMSAGWIFGEKKTTVTEITDVPDVVALTTKHPGRSASTVRYRRPYTIPSFIPRRDIAKK